VLDVLYLATTLALFALVGLIALGVDRLDRRSGPSASRGLLSRKARG